MQWLAEIFTYIQKYTSVPQWNINRRPAVAAKSLCLAASIMAAPCATPLRRSRWAAKSRTSTALCLRRRCLAAPRLLAPRLLPRPLRAAQKLRETGREEKRQKINGRREEKIRKRRREEKKKTASCENERKYWNASAISIEGKYKSVKKWRNNLNVYTVQKRNT